MAGNKSENNKKFFQDFLADYTSEEQVLIIAFAKWENNFSVNDFQQYLHDYLDCEVSWILASDDTSRLLNQIQQHKYIYICWGDHNTLYKKMRFLKEYKNIFENKIIAGSSAGTNILSEISFSNDYQKITYGLWLLHIWTMCHFKNIWIWKSILEQNNTQNIELLFLAEEEYKQIFVSK